MLRIPNVVSVVRSSSSLPRLTVTQAMQAQHMAHLLAQSRYGNTIRSIIFIHGQVDHLLLLLDHDAFVGWKYTARHHHVASMTPRKKAFEFGRCETRPNGGIQAQNQVEDSPGRQHGRGACTYHAYVDIFWGGS